MSLFKGMLPSGMIGPVQNHFYVYTKSEGNVAAFHAKEKSSALKTLPF